MRPYTLDPGKIMTLQEARDLLSYLTKKKGPKSAQAWIVARLGLEAGLRVSEMVKLRIDDCYLDRLILFIRNSKRGRSRAVRITPELADAIRHYVEFCRRPSTAPELIVGVATGKAITIRAVEALFKRALRAAGIPEHRRAILSPHSMRHTFATRSLEKGKNIAWVRNQLGHANVATTDVYLQVADLKSEAAVNLY